MYFAADTDSGTHIFRQSSPSQPPVQLTFGPTEESSFAISPDDRSLIASVSTAQRSAWVHRPIGDQQVSADGFTQDSSFSRDGEKLYYLWRSKASLLHRGTTFTGELRETELSSGRTETLLTDVELNGYDISADGKKIVYTTLDSSRRAHLWLASLDRHSPAREFAGLDSLSEIYEPRFGPKGDIFFLAREEKSHFIYRMNLDGTGRQKFLPAPAIRGLNFSPNGEWLVVVAPLGDEETTEMTVAYRLEKPGAPLLICALQCWPKWSLDGKVLYLSPSSAGGMGERNTFAIPLPSGKVFPSVPASGFRTQADIQAIPGAKKIQEMKVTPSPTASIYAFQRDNSRSNLYRIPLP
jgi:Tol biopolymer transport system component